MALTYLQFIRLPSKTGRQPRPILRFPKKAHRPPFLPKPSPPWHRSKPLREVRQETPHDPRSAVTYVPKRSASALTRPISY